MFMRKFGCDNLVSYNSELEKIVRRIQKEKNEGANLLQQLISTKIVLF